MQTSWIEEPKELKMHDWNIKVKKKLVQCYKPKIQIRQNSAPSKNKSAWTVSDIAKAGCLLASPPLPTQFEDEQEMRRVYTLIYDVFRYKNTLTQALDDVYFFLLYPQLVATKSHVWLLLYDLYHRGFQNRESAVTHIAIRLFEEAGLLDAEKCLWHQKTKLAAAISRLRIENSALSLDQLLPHHLRDDRVSGEGPNGSVTCWINIKKIKNPEDMKKQIDRNLGVKQADDMEELLPTKFKWDRHCPHIIAFHGSLRALLAKSDLVKNFKLIVQDKSFCLGPAAFVKKISELELAGSVIQTHVNSPRTTAYLAAILSQNEKIKKLMAFSAGHRKIEYETYFSQLGMTNILIFSDRLIDVSPDANYMEEVVAVFATPPNSYSAITDPIDLVCSRGGDLSMLEVLTESEETAEGKQRVAAILDEQRRTLRFAMSRPQIQFVLYETHSEIDAENGGMVRRTVKEVNKSAKLHHAALQGKLQGLMAGQPEVSVSVVPKLVVDVLDYEETNSTIEINNNEKSEENMVEEKEIDEVVEAAKKTDSLDSVELQSVEVPDTDIFDNPNLPSLCPSDTACLDYVKEGCFLALLQRKKVIKLDDKYMIQMAENRGLFGRTSSSSTRAKGSKIARKKPEKTQAQPCKIKRRLKESEITRIAAPTHTFLRHTTKLIDGFDVCPRCKIVQEEYAKPPAPIYKQWWSETTRHIMALKKSLSKPKMKSNKDLTKYLHSKTTVGGFLMDRSKIEIDELVAASRGSDNSSVPLFPRLKLTRYPKAEKTQMRLPITFVEFNI